MTVNSQQIALCAVATRRFGDAYYCLSMMNIAIAIYDAALTFSFVYYAADAGAAMI